MVDQKIRILLPRRRNRESSEAFEIPTARFLARRKANAFEQIDPSRNLFEQIDPFVVYR
jgi:hypothetical protein